METYDNTPYSIQDDDDEDVPSSINKHKGHTPVGGAIFNFVCTCVGAGIVSLPGAIGQVGWIGLLLVAIIGFFSNYTAKLLIASLHIGQKRLGTYEALGRECYGEWGYRIVAICQNITLFGVCTIFLILIGGNMNSVVPSLTLHDWVLIFGVCLIPVAWLKTMSEIFYLALFGVFASAVVGTVIIIKGIIAGEDSTDYETFNGGGLALGFNIIVFSFGFHSILPAVEHEMAEPEKFPFVANVSCIIITSFYLIVAACGYYGWGTGVDDNVLDSMNSDSVPVKIAYVFITAHVTFAYPLPLNPVALYLEKVFGVDKLQDRKEIVSRITLRTLLVIATMFLASVIPYFGDFLSLVSALSLVATAFIFPPLFYWTLKRRHGQLVTTGESIMMTIIMVMGVAGSAAGLYYSVKALIDDISSGGNPFDNFFVGGDDDSS